MNATTHRTARFGAALVAAVTALVLAAPVAAASPASRPPQLSGTQMHWYHWHPSQRVLQGQAAEFASTAVIGLESMRDLEALRAAYGFERVRPIPALHAAEVRVDPVQLRALLANALTDPRVRYVSPVGPLRRTTSMPNDPFLHTIDPATGLPYQWAFAAAHVDQALDFTPGSPRVVVGVIDTGIDNVPDLAGKIDSLWSVNGMRVDEVSVLEGNDDFGHGTAVASVIAANVDDHFGMAGTGGETHVIGVRASVPGGYFSDTSVAIALTKLDSLGVRIVNMSLGGRTPSEPILVDAIHKAAADGMLLVASSGNDHGHVGWPAADLQPADGGRSYGMAVGATTVDGHRAAFSDWGKHLSLVAPGDYGGLCSGVLVALPSSSYFDDKCFLTWTGDGGARYGNLAGTSFAAPAVAGIAALTLAARPQLENYQIADIIKQSARRDAGTGWTPEMGCGQLDAGRALELATSRSAAAWAQLEGDDAVCSSAGDQPPTWPNEWSQTITFAPIGNKKIGDSAFALKASASSGLPLAFTVNGNCIVVVATVHLTGAGSCSITASQEGDASHSLATSVSRSFLIADVPARKVVAVEASGRPGASVNLPFRVGAGNGDVAVKITVQKNLTSVARLDHNFFRVDSGHVYRLSWPAPKASPNAAYRFCVTLSDRAGRETAPSCARIRLR